MLLFGAATAFFLRFFSSSSSPPVTVGGEFGTDVDVLPALFHVSGRVFFFFNGHAAPAGLFRSSWLGAFDDGPTQFSLSLSLYSQVQGLSHREEGGLPPPTPPTPQAPTIWTVSDCVFFVYSSPSSSLSLLLFFLLPRPRPRCRRRRYRALDEDEVARKFTKQKGETGWIFVVVPCFFFLFGLSLSLSLTWALLSACCA